MTSLSPEEVEADKPDKPDKPKEKETALFVCTGKRRADLISATDELVIELYEVLPNSNGELAGPYHFGVGKSKKSKRTTITGGLYLIEVGKRVDGLSLYFHTAQYKGMYGDKGKVAGWQMLSDAEESAAQTIKREKSDKINKAALEAALLPIREAYHNTDYYGQLAIESILLRALRKRPVLTKRR